MPTISIIYFSGTGHTTKLAYVDQSRAGLDPAGTVWKEISGGRDTSGAGTRGGNSRQKTSWVQFRGAEQQKRVGELSGGGGNWGQSP